MTDRQRVDGIVPIISMPFDARGRIDHEDLCREVDYLAGLEVPSFGFGFGSEVLRLTDGERDEAVHIAAAQLGGRLPLLAGVTRWQCSRRDLTSGGYGRRRCRHPDGQPAARRDARRRAHGHA